MNVSGARQRVVTELRGGCLVEEGGVVVLDGDGVLADLLAPDHVVVGIAEVHPDDTVQDNDTVS